MRDAQDDVVLVPEDPPGILTDHDFQTKVLAEDLGPATTVAEARFLADAGVDAVIAQAVLEHVLDPHRCVEEIHRVLKPG